MRSFFFYIFITFVVSIYAQKFEIQGDTVDNFQVTVQLDGIASTPEKVAAAFLEMHFAQDIPAKLRKKYLQIYYKALQQMFSTVFTEKYLNKVFFRRMANTREKKENAPTVNVSFSQKDELEDKSIRMKYKVAISRLDTKDCYRCKGAGKDRFGKECRRCSGKGKRTFSNTKSGIIVLVPREEHWVIRDTYEECRTCPRYGGKCRFCRRWSQQDRHKCKRCKGSGLCHYCNGSGLKPRDIFKKYRMVQNSETENLAKLSVNHSSVDDAFSAFIAALNQADLLSYKMDQKMTPGLKKFLEFFAENAMLKEASKRVSIDVKKTKSTVREKEALISYQIISNKKQKQIQTVHFAKNDKGNWVIDAVYNPCLFCSQTGFKEGRTYICATHGRADYYKRFGAARCGQCRRTMKTQMAKQVCHKCRGTAQKEARDIYEIIHSN